MPLILVARFVASLVATSGGSFLIAAVPAAACLGAPTSNPAAATAVACAWGSAVPGDVARLVTVVTVAERAISLSLRLAPLPGLYDALKGSAIPCVVDIGFVDRTPRAAQILVAPPMEGCNRVLGSH